MQRRRAAADRALVQEIGTAALICDKDLLASL
jgi:hypothetical protein